MRSAIYTISLLSLGLVMASIVAYLKLSSSTCVADQPFISAEHL